MDQKGRSKSALHLIRIILSFKLIWLDSCEDYVMIDSFQQRKPQTINEVRTAVIQGGKRRVKAALMTTTTTLIALLPVLTSTGRGADLMVPMALPTFGGMAFQVVTLFIVPILYAIWKESQLKNEIK